MNPGTPVSETELNRTRNLIPSLISRTASSGRVETSKFSLIREGASRPTGADGRAESDIGQFAEELMVLVVAALPLAEGVVALGELDSPDPLDHLEAELVLDPQP
jgi:hypothetical protein